MEAKVVCWESEHEARAATNNEVSSDKHVQRPVSSNWELIIDIIHHNAKVDTGDVCDFWKLEPKKNAS